MTEDWGCTGSNGVAESIRVEQEAGVDGEGNDKVLVRQQVREVRMSNVGVFAYSI